MVIVYQAAQASKRVVTNLFAVPVGSGIIPAVLGLFTSDSADKAFTSAFSGSLDWSFKTGAGLNVTNPSTASRPIWRRAHTPSCCLIECLCGRGSAP